MDPTVKRFRAVFPQDTPAPEVGSRMIFPGDTLFEEWDLTWTGGGSFVPKRIGGSVEDRIGYVLRVEDQKMHHGREPYVHVIAEDEKPYRVTVGVLLTIIGPRMLAPPEDVFPFLDWLYGARLETDEQRLAVAHQAAPWLREQHRDLARIRWIPEYDAPAMYVAWLDGLAVHYGTHRPIKGCPIRFDLPPALNLSRATVRDDVTERLRRNGRAN
jgi:hypothetical protein